MIKIEYTEVSGWDAAIRGMRNPMNSWEKGDSLVSSETSSFIIGPNDLALMKKLAKAGTDHRKFMRMITVYCDITAPLYWWKEFDTYKVGTVANSCSTMHKIQAKRFRVDDFSHDYIWEDVDNKIVMSDDGILIHTVAVLNELRELYLKTKDKRYWYKMIQLLPSSYNQKRTVMMNYEVLANIYPSRKNHKLDEWHDFCDWIKTLSYSELITDDSKC